MTANGLLWVGLISCIGALLTLLFREAAFRLGADAGAAWLLFGFGVFLILTSAFVTVSTGQTGECGHRRRNDPH